MLLAAACAIGSFFLSAHLAALTAGYRKRRSARRRCISAARGQKESLLDSRRRDFCPALSVSYANREPLLIVQGCGAFLRDDGGRAYLDTRNNVAHVGHANPRVAAAVSAQVTELNTNTRYLHPNATHSESYMRDGLCNPASSLHNQLVCDTQRMILNARSVSGSGSAHAKGVLLLLGKDARWFLACCQRDIFPPTFVGVQSAKHPCA